MKIEILQKARLLKGSNIFVEEEYSQEVLAERKKLLPSLKQARKEGYKAFLKYNKLIIDEKIYYAPSESNEDEENTAAERFRFTPTTSNQGSKHRKSNRQFSHINQPQPWPFKPGDFNSRMGELNQGHEDQFTYTNLSATRKSMDPAINKRRKDLTELFENEGLMVINRRTPSDFPANCTYIGPRGTTKPLT
ncbi:hypothetical protein CBL_07155 [Carabus blaptoides fortunei]